MTTYSNPLLALLDNRGRASEDTTTGVLAARLRDSPNIRAVFVDFLFQGKTPKSVVAARLLAHNQYRFSTATQARAHVGSRGKIDLALIDQTEATFIGVEYKIRDCEKPGRLHNYRLLMDAEGLRNNWLFEVVQRREHDIEAMEYVDGVHTWNELMEFFRAKCPPFLSADDRRWIDHFLEFLHRSGTLVRADIVKRSPRAKSGLPSDTLKAILREIRRKLPSDTIGGVRIEKNLPHHLRLGRDSWVKKFPGNWHERVWMYLRQVPNSMNVYPIFQIIFYHAAYTSFDYAERHLPDWAARATSAGLLIWRGPDKGWDGKKRVCLEQPWRLLVKPKYFYAEELEKTVAAKALSIDNDAKQLVERAVAGFKKYGDIVESFRTQ